MWSQLCTSLGPQQYIAKCKVRNGCRKNQRHTDKGYWDRYTITSGNTDLSSAQLKHVMAKLSAPEGTHAIRPCIYTSFPDQFQTLAYQNVSFCILIHWSTVWSGDVKCLFFLIQKTVKTLPLLHGCGEFWQLFFCWQAFKRMALLKEKWATLKQHLYSNINGQLSTWAMKV